MKQFNLEEYLKNPNRKIITRVGKSVRIICTDKESLSPIVALVKEEKEEHTYTYLPNGRYSFITENAYDLFFAPEKKEGWINLFKINSTITTGEVYNTKEEAKSAVVGSLVYISTVKIEWEE